MKFGIRTLSGNRWFVASSMGNTWTNSESGASRFNSADDAYRFVEGLKLDAVVDALNDVENDAVSDVVIDVLEAK
jgi:hypothetical protein